jgi:hypothetical protein
MDSRACPWFIIFRVAGFVACFFKKFFSFVFRGKIGLAALACPILYYSIHSGLVTGLFKNLCGEGRKVSSDL